MRDFARGILTLARKAVEGRRRRAAFEPLERRVLMAAQVYEAEAAALSGVSVSVSHAGFTGIGYIDFGDAPGDAVQWAIEAESSGNYALDVRYANGGSRDRPLELRVDGALSGALWTFPRGNNWRDWKADGRVLTLSAGTHTVRLAGVGQGGPNVDSLTVRPVDPTPVPPASQTLEAEAAGRGGVFVAAGNTGYTGGGYVDFVHAAGDFVEWPVSVASGGSIDLSFRYANGSAADRPLQLTVNGQPAGSVSFPSTRTWSRWGTVRATVVLRSGVNTVRLTAQGFGGPNLDAMVVPAAPAPGEEVRSLRVYHIGNSLTNGINYASLDGMAATDGREYVFGRHVISGAPLSWIYDRPDKGNRQAPFGRYRDAFQQNEWDVLTLQPFDRQLYAADGSGDVQVAQKFIDLARQNSPNLQAYIYQHWPRRTLNADGSFTYDYERLWLRAYTGKWDRTYETRDYFNQLVTELRNSDPGAARPVLMVPVGDVMFELNRRIEAGQVPGIADIEELFQDSIHLTNWGALVVGTTFYATMYRRDPRGLEFRSYNVVDDPWDRLIPEGYARAVQQVVWDVVKGHPFLGVKSGI